MTKRTLRPPAPLLAAALALALLPAPARAADGAGAMLDAARAAMVRDPNEVLALVARARRALPAARDTAAVRDTIRADWLEAEARGRLGDLAAAERISAPALDRIARLDPGSKLHGDLLMTRGGIALDENRVRDAFGLFRQAHDVFAKLHERRSQAIALQNIGTIYSFAGDQRSVLRYYAQAQEVYRDDDALAQAAANNLGTAYRELKDYAKADAQFRLALTLARKLDSPVLAVRAQNNLAAVALLRGRPGEADAIADRALRIARDAETAEWAPFLWGVKAQVALARGDLPRAIALFDRTFADTKLAATSFYFRDFHKSAAGAFARAGQPDKAFAHLAAFKRLDDEAREIRSSTNAALAAAQFDFSTQELRIARLREGQLARDVKIERARARQQLILFLATFALLVVTTIAFLWIRRSRNATRAANRDLATSNTALDKALRAKSEFLAMTSHEIRTPLNGILGMTQVILARPSLDAEMRGQVGVVHSAGEAMKALVDDILDVSKMERGEITLDRAEADLHRLFGDVRQLWQGQAMLKGLTLTLGTDGLPRRALTDDARLRQIVSNLLSNAVKFTSAGNVSVRAQRIDEGLRVTVADTGIGIPAEHHAAIFESFQQVDAATTRAYGGTGLGLAIVSRLVTAFGGTIGLESAPGTGSTFTVELPMDFVAEPAAADTQDMLLIAEPNMLRQSMMRGLLAPSFGEVQLVADADAAHAALDAGACRLMLFDADALCRGDLAQAASLARHAAAAGTDCAILHAADAHWDRQDVAGALLLAKPIDGPKLLAALISIRVDAHAA